ncbi:hypothetical protein [Bacillus sp. V5-8f]|uniref:hypothetical protein n=1 Tax=Bacillus sp. V5-8f TaxID=2053044 RepID=UPI000C78027E|nr:hypothetical protein [Bacillus sp. V5-8f]PLT32080.1 hypothetical protein CUU64_21170 [Bacillus sp. V5-8f]
MTKDKQPVTYQQTLGTEIKRAQFNHGKDPSVFVEGGDPSLSTDSANPGQDVEVPDNNPNL